MQKDPQKLEVRTFQKLTDLNNKYVLEIGCGDGRLTDDLLEFTNHIVAIDPDEEKLSLAREAVPKAEFLISGGETLYFDDNSFDVVIFSLSLHHHENPQQALSEAYRVLKTDGALLVEEPVIGSELDAFFSLIKDETEVVDNAYNALIDSRFKLAKKQMLKVPTPFGNLEELREMYAHREQFTEAIWQKMLELLKDINTNEPFIIMDEVVVYKLNK